MTTHKRFGTADLRRIRDFATRDDRLDRRESIDIATKRATAFVLVAFLGLLVWALPDLIAWIASWRQP